MDHAEGAGSERCDRVEFRGARLSSYGGLLVMRKMDEVFGLSDFAFTTVNGSLWSQRARSCASMTG